MTGGLWLAFIGWFLLTAAAASARQAEIDATLEGLRALDLLTREIAWLEGWPRSEASHGIW